MAEAGLFELLGADIRPDVREVLDRRRLPNMLCLCALFPSPAPFP